VTATVAVAPSIPADAHASRSEVDRDGLVTLGVVTTLVILSYTAPLVGRGVLWSAPAALIALFFRARVVRIRVSASLVAFTGWLVLTGLLAGLPKGSFTLMLLVGVIAAGAACAGFDMSTIGRALVWGTALPVAVSVATSMGGLASAREQGALYAGAWRGIFNQKNSLGFAAALLIALCVTQYRELPRLSARALLVLGGVALVGSRSVSALGALAFALTLYALVAAVGKQRGRRLGTRALVGLAVVLCVAVVVALPRILGDFGRDPTLTGRTVMWTAFSRDAHHQLLTGYAPGGYWFSAAGKSTVASIRQTLHFAPGQAHNGVLDVVLDAGLPALLLLTVLALAALRRALAAFQAGRSWPLFVLAFGIMTTYTERGLYSAPMLFVVAIIVSVPAVAPGRSG
jgi:O-antigen ligase